MKLLHFTATWCNPCQMMKPMIAKVIEEHPEIDYVVIDIDENSETAQDYGIMSVPSFILYDGDTVKATAVGGMTKNQFLTALGIV
jgi:thioredoxin 1